MDAVKARRPNAIVGGPFGSDLVSRDYSAIGVPVIRGQNMGAPWVKGPFVFVSAKKADALAANTARPGDLVFTQRGTLGQVSMIPEGEYDRYVVSQSQMKVSLDTSVANPTFIFYVFTGDFHQELIRQSTIQTGVPHINLGILRRFHVPCPPLLEQQAIAAALADVDALLDLLVQLIAKKRDLKQAAMQHLLTGHVRLPGFRGDWENLSLGDVGPFSKGRGIRRDEVIPAGYPCVRYGEIYTHHADHVRQFFSFVSADVAKGSRRLRAGDLLFAASGETAEEIGKCVAFIDDAEAYAGGDIVILSPTAEDSRFLGYLMNHESIARQKANLGQGDAVVHISASNLARIRLRLPERAEQEAIAQVLWDMDNEILALEHRLAKTRALKQGMMQALLTGRVRLPQPAAV